MILQNLTKYIQQADEAVFPSGIYCICCGSLIDGTRTYALCDTCIRRFHWNVGETCGKCGKALRRIDLGKGCEPEPVSDPGEGYEPEHFDEPGEGYEPEPVKDPGEGYEPELAADLIRTPAGKGGLGQDEAPELPAIGRPRLCYDCMREERLFRKGFSCLTYGLHERELMMALKYNGSGFIAVKCGDMMFDRIEEEVRDGLFAPGRNPIDLIAAVPVSASRYRKRGYNQSALMARQLVRRWKAFVREEKHKGSGSLPEEPRAEAPGHRVPVFYDDLMERTRKTKMLRGLNPAERRLELQGAFRVREPYRLKLQGKRALLIDDIYTTGATADACSQALLEGGAMEVYLLTWASGGNRRPGEM